jgi:hypothetical protein
MSLPKGKRGHEKNTGFQTRKSMSDRIEEATLIFRKQLADYWAIQDQLYVKFREMAPAFSDANMTDLMVVSELQARTADSAMKIVAALERLARLSHFIE